MEQKTGKGGRDKIVKKLKSSLELGIILWFLMISNFYNFAVYLNRI